MINVVYAYDFGRCRCNKEDIIWSDYILVTFWLHIMVYGYTESDVIAESRGWNAMSGDNDVVCVLWICVVVGTESYVCDQLPKLPEEPPPIGDCIEEG